MVPPEGGDFSGHLQNFHFLKYIRNGRFNLANLWIDKKWFSKFSNSYNIFQMEYSIMLTYEHWQKQISTFSNFKNIFEMEYSIMLTYEHWQ